MNTQDFLTVLDYMEKEKGISRKVMASVIESALVTAAHKTYPLETEIRVALDAKTGKIQMFAKLKATDRARPNPDEISIVKARSVNPSAAYRDWETDRKSTRLNSSHSAKSRMPSSA